MLPKGTQMQTVVEFCDRRSGETAMYFLTYLSFALIRA